MISIINEGIKEHLKKHGGKYILGGTALGALGVGGAMGYQEAKEKAEMSRAGGIVPVFNKKTGEVKIKAFGAKSFRDKESE